MFFYTKLKIGSKKRDKRFALYFLDLCLKKKEKENELK